MEEQIIIAIEKFTKAKYCALCGGEIKDGKCTFCKVESPKTPSLEQIIGEQEITFKIYVALLGLKDLDDPFVNRIIPEYRPKFRDYVIAKFLDDNFEDIIYAIDKPNINFLFDSNKFFLGIARSFFLHGASNVSDNAYLKFLSMYIERILMTSNMRDSKGRLPKLDFVSSEEMQKINAGHKVVEKEEGICIVSGNGRPKVIFDREIFIEKKGQPLKENMETIYHEFQHAIQGNYFKNPDRYCVMGLLMAKDYVLSQILPGYQKENYVHSSFEVDAYYSSLHSVIKDLEMLKLYEGQYDETLKTIDSFRLATDRTHRGVQVNLHDLFESLPIQSDALEYYPILSLEYSAPGPYLVRRSKQEIESLRESTKEPKIREVLDYILSTYKKDKEPV